MGGFSAFFLAFNFPLWAKDGLPARCLLEFNIFVKAQVATSANQGCVGSQAISLLH